MKLKLISPKIATKPLVKLLPMRSEMDSFKEYLIRLLGKIDEIEREENQKIHVRDFLRDTYYKETNEINTKGAQDLVIHLGKTNKDKVGVIIEAKRPKNTSEMITESKPNVKALHELVLYYMRERIDEGNIDIKYCIATNIYEWFVFDAQLFEKCFVKNNKAFVKSYEDWRDGKKVGKDTDFFYKEIVQPHIEKLDEVEAAYFDIRNYEKELKDNDKANDKKLVELYRILSPYHLLRVSAIDSNTLNDKFYKELLHIIGLEETKDGGRTIINRKAEGKRDTGSLIENAINILQTEDPLGRVSNLSNYGTKRDEQFYYIALELSLTWINRILFLKLLEGQLVNYHKGDTRYKFLNTTFVQDYDELYKLFHQVLAIGYAERSQEVTQKYGRVPYLNSSLFDISELEYETIKINSLNDREHLQLLPNSVLKEKKTLELPSLEYLFKFLDAYDFGSDSKEEDVQEDNKTLINASVLGKVFEKINGYKDGSIYTPGFITMYMCKQAIRPTVVQKFKEVKGWDITSFDELYNKIADHRSPTAIKEFNSIVNSLHICDPAVGSGHFLVSALNELIAVKAELGILADGDGKRFAGLDITVANDELIVTDESGNPFVYQLNEGKPINKEVQRLQETLFHEKQTIIENCLFGVDINPNSVKICRLRLWIELLKNAYYKASDELETLPNIDINIKCGNSLLSRFSLDTDLHEAFKKQQYNLETYKTVVANYRISRNRGEKAELLKLIEKIKSEYTQTIFKKDPRRVKIADLRGQLELAKNNYDLFGKKLSDKDQKLEQKRIELLLAKRESELEEAEKGTMYRNAFEWRFEFPEVLDANGKFIGFDILIGNPPYISAVDMARSEDLKKLFKNKYPEATGAYDIYVLFLKIGLMLLKSDRFYSWIVPNKFLIAKYSERTKQLLLENGLYESIDVSVFNVFEEVSVYPIIINGANFDYQNYSEYAIAEPDDLLTRLFIKKEELTLYPTFFENGLNIVSGATGFEAQKLKPLISETQEKKAIPFVVSGNIKRYFVNKEDVRYMGNKYKNAFIANKDGVLAASKWALWCNPKIIIAGMTKVIRAYYCPTPMGLGVGVYAINEFNGFDPYYITAVLNSNFMTYYVNEKFKDKHLAGGYLAINKNTIEQFPLVKPSKILHERIVELSKKITEVKEYDTNSEIDDFSMQIDKLIYKVYDLTPEEIEIVEGRK